MSPSPSRPSNEDTRSILLPVGYRAGSRLERRVLLRTLRGRAQLRLLDMDPFGPREQVLSRALACCTATLGDLRDPAPEVMHELSLSDRHALVRELMLASGARTIAVTASCGECHTRLELSLDLAAVAPSVELAEPLVLTRRHNGRAETCPLRLPRPADLEEGSDELSVVARCTRLSRREARKWLRTAEQTLSASDPLGQIEIVGTCPEGGHRISAPYDMVADWLGTLRRRSEDLLQEIHLLALNYHWSEADILRLPESRRRAYLDLCWSVEAPAHAAYA